jgi:molybdopterin-guanine dinucleotide biosynthesis protein A
MLTSSASRTGALTGTLGAILAGGASRRFGGTKALALLQGSRLVARAARAVAGAVDHAVVITDDPAIAVASGLPSRADGVPRGGPLAGLATALEWALERGDAGVLLLACDLPLVDTTALRRLLDAAAPPATAPFSVDGTPQPLCAWYSLEVLPVARKRLTSAELSMRGLLDEVAAIRIPAAALAHEASAVDLFLNVNTASDLDGADRVLRRLQAGGAPIRDA